MTEQARDTAWPYGRAQQHNAFSRERRVRFLDALALEGNVRAASIRWSLGSS